MLFHEPVFLFLFLPLAILFYLTLRTYASQTVIVAFLCIASIIFYGWWNPNFVPLICGSILFNFWIGKKFHRRNLSTFSAQALITLGVAANLALLFFFKYLSFAIDTINSLGLITFGQVEVELPLGISFFTFLQIAYLVDCYRGQTRESGFAPYFLFVTFFPHLIAGPLIHHSEMIPQFYKKANNILDDFSVGLTIFCIGLFKKLILSKQMAIWSDSVFDGAAAGIEPTLVDAWVGALCFTFQIYFDFSGYSDMAIGLSRLFGIRLPVNFASPYKAANIIDFWHRWHITLSRFLRDYLYIPLGGNRRGKVRRYANLMIVMLLAGLWHGASWKFVIWGGLHGLYLMINHGWIALQKRLGYRFLRLPAWMGLAITFFAVVVAWVPFRADSIETTAIVLNGMIGANGVVLPAHYASLLNGMLGELSRLGVTFGALSAYGGGWQIIWLAACLAFVWLLPNTQEILHRYEPALRIEKIDLPKAYLNRWIVWEPRMLIGLAVGLTTAYLCFLAIQGTPGEFIYFQF